MNCEEYRESLKSWLKSRWEVKEDELEVPEHLKEHAAECSNCATKLVGALLLVSGKGVARGAS